MDRPRTKQVCTIGPASADKIPDLVASGMDVARINFAHGTADEHKAYVHAVRAAAHSARRSVAVMADLPGPKIRLGELEGGQQRLQAGTSFVLNVPGADLAAKLQVGDRVLMADGAVELKVTEVADGQVTADVLSGGLIRSRSGVNIPSERFGDGGLTDEDRAAVPRALELRVDLLAQSFVRSAADVVALKQLLPADGPRVVAKIETRAALDDFDAIAAVADGIMVARGDLGVDIPFEVVPMIQKDLVRRGTAAGRFTIVATQMLESMTAAARPTRAEASDVANAVVDGADAVMLSAETAIGEYPVEALHALERICSATEASGGDLMAGAGVAFGKSPAEEMIAAASYVAARNGVGQIWCFTRTGRTAELLSLQRPSVPIVAFTLSPVVARRLAVRRGVVPLVLPAGAKNVPLNDQMEAAWHAQRSATANGDNVLLVTTSSQPGGINRLEFHQLGAAARK
ncbi:MAG: pyruvate kinase [Candidatus Limnocylindrales bacterium]